MMQHPSFELPDKRHRSNVSLIWFKQQYKRCITTNISAKLLYAIKVKGNLTQKEKDATRFSFIAAELFINYKRLWIHRQS